MNGIRTPVLDALSKQKWGYSPVVERMLCVAEHPRYILQLKVLGLKVM